MQVTIIKKNRLNIFALPENISGSYWLTDFENGRKINLINIEASDNGWNIISNHDAYIVDGKNIMIPYTILKNYNFYVLKNNYRNESYYIYCSPLYENNYKELGINSKIDVGFDSSCEVSYKLGGIPGKAFRIEKKDKYYYLTNIDKNASCYLNEKRVLNDTRLEYGDIIFIFGLKLILMRKDGYDYLLVNNPNNLLQFNASFVNVTRTADDYKEKMEELPDDSLYRENNYFYRTPHFYKTLQEFVLNVDIPPNKKDDDKTPAALTIGPMITMSMSSVIMLLTNLNQISRGEKDLDSSFTSLLMCGAMLASSLLWPILTRTYQKISSKMYERKRQKLYKKYIERLEKKINDELEIQRKSLIENNFTVETCQNIIRAHNVKLWQRRITDADFLTLPVGIGETPMKIKINYPEQHFTLEEDNLLEIAHSLGRKPRILKDVPITFSFYENKTTGVVGDSLTNKAFIDRLVLQMMANFSYDELKIVTFTSIDNEKDWDYIKTIPHSWSNDKTLRFFGSSNEDYREIIYNLEKIYNERKMLDQDTKYLPYYVIITDAIKSVDSFDFIKNIMANQKNYGFSIIILADKVSALPNECKSFINVSPEECSIYSSIINLEQQKFRIDFTSIEEIYNCAKELANIPIEIKSEVESSLPDLYQFLEMYQIGKIEQLNSWERWKKSNPILSLQAPIGIGKSGELINLDLHEKYHGPHGLIAGTTGSGKSEFIMTYILSLAVNYHPFEVQIILIDYKGGSLAGAFSNDMYQLPHLAGTITNLDGNELNRSLESIESEIKRRQKEFNEARNLAKESNIDIYKYQKLWREGRLPGMNPIAHLFIISDEFAELKEQQPEFMDKLISAARVGRSLGIHLILATQKPGGVVDPQIWSNTRFRVCLKVQDTSDSQEVIKKPDAAYLKKTGRFYLQVGTDEVFTLGQSAYAGGQYYPSNTFKKDVDTSVNVINNIGFITTTKDIKKEEEGVSLGEELPNIVKYLAHIAKENNISIKKLWLDKIPPKIYIDNLKIKYDYNPAEYIFEPLIGEYDDPANQTQQILTIPFTKLGNVIIYGIAGSGKESFLTSLIYSSMVSYKVEDVNFYIVDFGAETLRVFNTSPYIGDLVFLNEGEKLHNLFKMLYQILDERKRMLASFGGSLLNYAKEMGKSLPNIVVIINNYEAFLENYEELTEDIITLSRDAFKYGLYFVITASNDNSIRSKVRQNFSLIYCLGQNNDADYANILGNVRGKYPAKNKGRGLFRKDTIYEFQTAFVKEDNEYEYLKNYCQELKDKGLNAAPKIPVLPDVVGYEEIKNDLTTSPNLVVGINKNKLTCEKYNFSKNAINLISAYELENVLPFLNSFLKETIYTKYYQVLLFNTSELDIHPENITVYDNGFEESINNLKTYIEQVYKSYEESNYNEEFLVHQKKFMCVIFGVYDFFNKLSSETKASLTEMIKLDNQINLISFVLVDNPDILKGFAYEEWFKSGCDTSKGIFIASGVADQNLFRVAKFSQEDRQEIANNYGYIIQNGRINKIKVLTDFNVK